MVPPTSPFFTAAHGHSPLASRPATPASGRDAFLTNGRLNVPRPLLRFARDAARPRVERQLRALERVLDTACARARLEGQGGGGGTPRRASPHRHEHLCAPSRDPARDVRARPP